MPTAEIITIGTEILLGEILDTNARHLALSLRETGIDLFRKTTVGDNPTRIAQVIREALARCEIIITTGGLGPTVDDPTREAVALAFDVETEFHPELWEQIQDRFQRFNRQPTENNRRQAFIPQGAIAIENPVGTAPAFVIERDEKSLIALPGVPSEMHYLLKHTVLPYLLKRYQISTVLKTRTIHTAGAGESQIDDLIGDLEELSNPTVGLAAHSGQVDVRIVARANSVSQAENLLTDIEQQIRQRLGGWIYGIDQVTLEEVAIQALESRDWKIAIFEAGSGGEISRRLAAAHSPTFAGGEITSAAITADELPNATGQYRQSLQAEVGLGILIQPGVDGQIVSLVLMSPEGTQIFQRPFGGPPDYAPRWAAHHSLDLIRKFRKDNL